MLKKILTLAILAINIYGSEYVELAEKFHEFNRKFESIIITHQYCQNCSSKLAAVALANYWHRDACLNGNASGIMPLLIIPEFSGLSAKKFFAAYVVFHGSQLLPEDMPDARSRLFVEEALSSAKKWLENNSNDTITLEENDEDDDSDFPILETITSQVSLIDYVGDKLLLGSPTSDLANADWYTVDITKGNQNLIADLRRQETYDYIVQERPQGFARVLDEFCYTTTSEMIRRNAAALTASGGIFCAPLRQEYSCDSSFSFETLNQITNELMASGFSRVILGDMNKLETMHGLYYDKHLPDDELIVAFESASISLGQITGESGFHRCSILAIK